MNRKFTKAIIVAISASFLLVNLPQVEANQVQADETTDLAEATYGKKLPKNTYVTVSYWPGRSIHVYRQNDNHKFVHTGEKIKNGVTHRIYNQKKVGKYTYYYEGHDKWINAKNTIKYELEHTRYNSLKKDPASRTYYTSQYFPVFAPWGCALAALSMLMKYDHSFKNVPGVNEQGKLTYMQNNLPRNVATGGQDGNPYTGANFHRVILSYALMNYAHRLGDSRIKDVSGISLNNIKKLIFAGKPVLYYGYSSYDAAGSRNHCKVIFGYSTKSDKFLVHDPLYQAKRFYAGGGGRNNYDLGPISWVPASHIKMEFAYHNGNNALTIK